MQDVRRKFTTSSYIFDVLNIDAIDKWFLVLFYSEGNDMKNLVENISILSDNLLVETLLKGEIMRIKELCEKCHVHQSSDGRWYANVNGKQIRKTKYEDILRAISDPNTINLVWNGFICNRKECVGLSRDTIHKDEFWYERYIGSSELADIPFGDIRIPDLKKFYVHCCNIYGDKLKRKYWNGVIGTVSKVFQYAIDLGAMSSNPVRDLKLERNAFAPATLHDIEELCFSETEERAVINKACELGEAKCDPLYLGVALMFKLGTRISEFNALQWNDIKDDRVYITKSCVNDGRDIQKRTKTYSGIRYIPLSDEALKMLKRIKEMNESIGYPVGGNAFLFYRKRRGNIEKATNRCLDSRLRTIQNRFNLNAGCIRSSHDIRRTFCTDILGNPELNVRDAQIYMGHGTPQQTMDYLKVSDKRRSDEIFRNTVK